MFPARCARSFDDDTCHRTLSQPSIEFGDEIGGDHAHARGPHGGIGAHGEHGLGVGHRRGVGGIGRAHELLPVVEHLTQTHLGRPAAGPNELVDRVSQWHGVTAIGSGPGPGGMVDATPTSTRTAYATWCRQLHLGIGQGAGTRPRCTSWIAASCPGSALGQVETVITVLGVDLLILFAHRLRDDPATISSSETGWLGRRRGPTRVSVTRGRTVSLPRLGTSSPRWQTSWSGRHVGILMRREVTVHRAPPRGP